MLYLLQIDGLTHCGLKTSMARQIWVNIGSDNGLLFLSLHLRAISQEVLINLICIMCSEIKLFKLLPHLP